MTTGGCARITRHTLGGGNRAAFLRNRPGEVESHPSESRNCRQCPEAAWAAGDARHPFHSETMKSTIALAGVVCLVGVLAGGVAAAAEPWADPTLPVVD